MAYICIKKKKYCVDLTELKELRTKIIFNKISYDEL